MNCKRCGTKIESKNLFCGNCGWRVDESEKIYTENLKDSEISKDIQNYESFEEDNKGSDIHAVIKSNSNKKIIAIGAGIAAAIVLISIIVIMFSGNTERKMKQALDRCSVYNVNTLYNQAYGDAKKTAKYDDVISQFLDDVIDELNNVEFSEENLAEDGYTVIESYMEDMWGHLVYSEDSETIEPSISYTNQDKWELLNNIIESKKYFCSGFAYRDSYKQPKDAIDVFNKVIPEDSFYSQVDEELAKCVDLYVEQTLKEAETLIKENDVSGAINLIEGINSYLGSNGITSETVQDKLLETKNKYAQTYVKKAEECFKKKDINGAIGNIEVAIELVPENAEYKTKKDTYEMYLPLCMYNEDNILAISVKERIRIYDDIEAVNKKVYDNCLTYRYYKDCKDGTVKYMLEGKYDTVSGVFLSPKTNATNNRTGSCYFVVKGDGKELYKSKTISAESSPIKFSFSVKNVQKLEITFIGKNSSVWGVDAYYYGDFASISNLTAQKEFPN